MPEIEVKFRRRHDAMSDMTDYNAGLRKKLPSRNRSPRARRMSTRAFMTVLLMCMYIGVVRSQIAGERSDECVADSSNDLSLSPRWWCEHNATHTLDTSCHVKVVETITVPWWNGTLTRTINVLDGQFISPGSVRALSVGTSGMPIVGTTSLEIQDPPSIEGYDSMGSKQVVITISHSERRTNATVWELEYELRNGVIRYAPCGGNPVAGSDISDAATIWRPEGVSIQLLKFQAAIFRALSKNLIPVGIPARVLFDGQAFSSEPGFSIEEKQTLVRLNLRLLGSYKLFEFVREADSRYSAAVSYLVVHGVEGVNETCPVTRQCAAEDFFANLHSFTQITEEPEQNIVVVIFIVLGVVLGMVVVLFAVYYGFKRFKKNKEAPDVEDPSDESEDVAKSPRHPVPGILQEEDEEDNGVDLFETGSPQASKSEFWSKAGGSPSNRNTPSEGVDVVSPKSLLRKDFENSTLHASPKNARKRKDKPEEAAVSPKDLLRKDFASTTLEHEPEQTQTAKEPH